jgi:hypothetical protein
LSREPILFFVIRFQSRELHAAEFAVTKKILIENEVVRLLISGLHALNEWRCSKTFAKCVRN